MGELTLRRATLDDTGAITALHTAAIPRWQRLDAGGRVEDVPYADLSLFERWQHGGPWLSVELCAIWLSHLLAGAGLPLVAVRNGVIVAEAEAFFGEEPDPFGAHVHLGVLRVADGEDVPALTGAVVDHLIALGRAQEAERLTMSEAIAETLHTGYKLTPLAQRQHITWPVRAGRGFYQATPHTDADPALIRGWVMPFGRGQSAHQEWVTRWPALWIGVPEIHAQRVERLKFTVAGGAFYVLYVESPYDPREATVYAWTPRPPTGPMVIAINDRAHKLGFRRLRGVVAPGAVEMLGPEVETDAITETVYSLAL